MKLSIVVPFFNVEHQFADCLSSLSRQSLRDVEVILVDDGSQDGSRSIAERFIEDDKRFKLVTQENQGLGPARNTGARHATGDFITFVDSDDLVPRLGYEKMIRRLEESGSDFAAGDARRFNRHGSRESWIHRKPFARRRDRTNIREFPTAALDRMVWNKVFRHSFWKEGGFEFPAMLYEDYPVTLRAHLQASSVDLLPDTVYYWRERDAGGASITQRVFELENVRDRVRSAEYVLDLLPTATPAIRQEVQLHLATTDLNAIATAVVLPDNEEDQKDLLDLAQQLLEALGGPALDGLRPIERVQAYLIREGLADELRDLVAVRTNVAPTAPLVRRGLVTRRFYSALPFFEKDPSRIPVSAYAVPPEDIKLEADVLEADWRGGRLILNVRARLTYLHTHEGLYAGAYMRSRRTGIRFQPQLELLPSSDDENAVRLMIRVDVDDLHEAGGRTAAEWELWLALEGRGIRRTGRAERVPDPSVRWCLPRLLADSSWAQPGMDMDAFTIHISSWPTVLEGVEHRGGELFLTGRFTGELDPAATTLVLTDSHDRDAVCPAVVTRGADNDWTWRAHVRLDEVVDPEHFDDLIEEVWPWRLRLHAGGVGYTVRMNPDLRMPRFVHAHREIQVNGGPFGAARLLEQQPQFVIERLSWLDGETLSLGGRYLDEAAPSEFAVLQWYIEDLDDPDEVRVPLRFHGHNFEFAVNVGSLSRHMSDRLSDTKGADLDLHYWDVSFEHDCGVKRALLSPDVVRRLGPPIEAEWGSARVTAHRGLAMRIVVEPDASGFELVARSRPLRGPGVVLP